MTKENSFDPRMIDPRKVDARMLDEIMQQMGDIRKERSDLSQEEAKELIDESITIKPRLQKIVGKENAVQVEEYINDQEIKDLDLMTLTGQVTYEEVFEYAFLLPEVQGIFQVMDQLANEIALYIRKNSWEYAQSKVYKDRGQKIDAREVSKFIELFRETWMEGLNFVERPMQPLFVHYLARCIFRELRGFILADLEAQPGGLERIVVDFHQRGAYSGKPEQNFATDLLNVYAFKKSQFRQSLVDTFSKNSISEEEIHGLLNEVNELSIQHNIACSDTVGDFTIELSPYSEKTMRDFILQRPVFLCGGNISLPPVEGQAINNVRFGLYRFTGELVTSKNFPLADLIGSAASENLKFYILSILKDHIPKSTPSQTEDSVTTADEGIIPSSEPEKFVYKKPKDSSIPESEPEPIEKAGKEISVADIKGIKSSRIKQALINILGEPVRITGSHHVFKCRNGKTYPIAIHPTEAMGVGLLTKCLRKFGVSPAEMKAEIV